MPEDTMRTLTGLILLAVVALLSACRGDSATPAAATPGAAAAVAPGGAMAPAGAGAGSVAAGAVAGPTAAGDPICNRGLSRVLEASDANDATQRIEMAIGICQSLDDWRAAAAASPQSIPGGEEAVKWLTDYCGRNPQVNRYRLCAEALAAR